MFKCSKTILPVVGFLLLGKPDVVCPVFLSGSPPGPRDHKRWWLVSHSSRPAFLPTTLSRVHPRCSPPAWGGVTPGHPNRVVVASGLSVALHSSFSSNVGVLVILIIILCLLCLLLIKFRTNIESWILRTQKSEIWLPSGPTATYMQHTKHTCLVCNLFLTSI